ncbi:dTDP-glucose 4,6-dehydratase [Planctomycetales bacterium]|nr:dTDP-glucose 4,6-dehydratase [Planctomycetales bacterium]GHS99253.1 dTDP-glucose 4,6-dehydratase [Planctomycetales bacterium]GHT04884.1 dTDP-glucose 4,6-dehydratase [Planctomycetales bacterium]
MKVLITGGAGFIGSNFVPYFAARYPDYFLVNLDLLTYAGDLANLREMAGVKNYAFVEGDIGDAALVSALFAQYDFDGVIHFAAESHVDNSIANPRAFVETNVLGAFTLLDAARAHWRGETRRFHHISTDEVYGSLGATGLFTEATPYAPNSPYSASKAASDMLVRAFHHTYGINATISNCSNNYGPKQHAEKLIPTIIRKALSGENIPLYGDGKNVRDWLYVLDHCRAIDLIFHRGAAGETYNVGGKNERTNLEIVAAICAVLDERRPRAAGSYKEQITFVADRLGHDRRYAIDATKLATHLGWQAQESFDTGIVKTVEWYLAASGGI